MNDLDGLIEVYKAYLELVKVSVSIQEPRLDEYVNKYLESRKRLNAKQKKETDSGTRLDNLKERLERVLKYQKLIEKTLSNPETIQTFREYAKGFLTQVCYSEDLIKKFEEILSLPKNRGLRDPFFVGVQMDKNNTVVYSFTDVARGLK